MALIQCRFKSQTLNMSTSMTVILPDNIASGTRVPTLYLLHGYSDDDLVPRLGVLGSQDPRCTSMVTD